MQWGPRTGSVGNMQFSYVRSASFILVVCMRRGQKLRLVAYGIADCGVDLVHAAQLRKHSKRKTGVARGTDGARRACVTGVGRTELGARATRDGVQNPWVSNSASLSPILYTYLERATFTVPFTGLEI